MIIKKEQDQIRPYLEDASGLNGAHTDKVYLPENYQEVSQILKEASTKKTPITISGGGTGVTGGRLPFIGEVLAMDKLNKILDLNNSSITVQAGVPITEIHAAAESLGYFYPPDATEWTAFIGGNIATNASGARTFKYGATRRYVKRIKVVLSSGEILDIERGKQCPMSNVQCPMSNYKMPDIKNAAGYYSKPGMELIDLFIGSEGTLGVVVEAELGILPKVGFVFAGFAFFEQEEKALNFVEEVKGLTFESRKRNDETGLDALAIEFFDFNALTLLRTKNPGIPSNARALIFFEEEITPQKEGPYLEKWGSLLEKHGVSLDDVWTADSPSKEKELKDIRHSMPEAVNEVVKKRGFPKAGTDIAVPHENFREMFNYYREVLAKSSVDNLIFGHIGDSHLHVNMLPKSEEELRSVKDCYIQFVRKAVSLGGTASAEHGIGKLKHAYLKEMYGQQGIDEMIRVKKALDFAYILGPDNIFPRPTT
jgi:D-lactate dehydrogenase (cytochrome)